MYHIQHKNLCYQIKGNEIIFGNSDLSNVVYIHSLHQEQIVKPDNYKEQGGYPSLTKKPTSV